MQSVRICLIGIDLGATNSAAMAPLPSLAIMQEAIAQILRLYI
jgi:hypothetical protein